MDSRCPSYDNVLNRFANLSRSNDGVHTVPHTRRTRKPEVDAEEKMKKKKKRGKNTPAERFWGRVDTIHGVNRLLRATPELTALNDRIEC